MKKRVLFVFLALVLLISISQTLGIDNDDQERIYKAYWCLNSKVGDCSLNNVDELVYSFLAIDECKEQLLAKRSSEGCWPSSGCNIKDTAKAVIAINEKKRDVENFDVLIENGLWWILGQETVPRDLTWLLQIHASEPTTCTISWADKTRSTQVRILDNYKLSFGASAGAGFGEGCFSLYTGNYWLKIKEDCMDEKFYITCEKGFMTNLLYTKDGSTIFVTQETHEKVAGGETDEKISSLCFGSKGSCDYEGTLWAALAFAMAGHTNEYALDHKPYLPYLMADAEGRNLELFPEAFLTYLGRSEYKQAVNEGQTTIKLSQGYWKGKYGEHFDTALILWLGSAGTEYKNKAIKWLLADLEANNVGGCWKGGNAVRDTALILYTLWPDNPFDCDISGERDRCDLGYICDNKECVEGCAEDEGCPSGEICEPDFCIEGCRIDDDCPGDLLCTDDWRCVEPPECSVATEKEDCDKEHICGQDNLCVEGCLDDTYCKIDQVRICDKITKLCVDGCRNDTWCEDREICEDKDCVLGCRIDDDCGEGKICTSNHECIKGCRNTEDCILGYICTANLTCVKGCRGDEECDEGKICEDGGCVSGCRTSANCPAGQVCSSDKKCVDCITSEDCTKREWCVGDDCIPLNWECAEDDHCPAGKFCEDHVCVDCIYDVNCPVGMICSPNYSCVECVHNSDCEQGYECGDNNKCVELPECTGPEDCKPDETCEQGYCISDSVECVYDWECTQPGYVCDNETNTCVAEEECYLPSDCAPGYTCIDEYCVPIEDDECELNSDCDWGYYCNADGECVLEEEGDCEDEGFYCRSSVDCRDDSGNFYEEYYCPGALKCCSVDEQPTTCEEEEGIICSSNQVCSDGGTRKTTDDLRYGEICCVSGSCKSQAQASECELAGGACRYDCYSDEESVSKDCEDSSKLCCMEQTTECSSDSDCEDGEVCNEYGRCISEPGGSLTWIWILLILIVLVVLGIIFRDKLRPLLFRIKSMFGKSRKPSRRPGLPPPSGPSSMAGRPMPPRRILPPQRGPIARGPGRPPAVSRPKPKSELDDVLKKLKDIGK